MIDEIKTDKYIREIQIKGFRGFKDEVETVVFAYPYLDSNIKKSGLNILVGKNCSGKSTILEAIKLTLLNNHQNGLYITKSMKQDNIDLFINSKINGGNIKIETRQNYFAKKTNINAGQPKMFIIPAKKNINSNELQFHNESIDTFLLNFSANDEGINRRNYNQTNGSLNILTVIDSNREIRQKFDGIFNRFLPNTKWHLYRSESDGHGFTAEFTDESGVSFFEGVGDGIITILYICVGLMLLETKEVDILIIDEPEVSLHPEIIKKLAEILSEYSMDNQIIIATHSPYFVIWESIKKGGKFIRIVNDGKIKTFSLDNSIIENIEITPSNNPHLYGYTSNEIFFQSDNVIIVEGQQDIVAYKKILEKIGSKTIFNFYGWGAGGASNIINIVNILKSLGYKKIVAIFDGDKEGEEQYDKCNKKFKNDKYLFKKITAKDIKDKYEYVYDPTTERISESKQLCKEGIVDKDYELKKDFNQKYYNEMKILFNDIDNYFTN